MDENNCKDICSIYQPGISYHTSCVDFCTQRSHTDDMCTWCKNNELSFSGYNEACQYFSSAAFLDPNGVCYHKKMSDCQDRSSWFSKSCQK